MVVIMEGEQQGSEGRRPNLSQARGALTPDECVFILGDTLDEHEFSLRSKVLNAEESTRPHLLVLVTQTTVEEG